MIAKIMWHRINNKNTFRNVQKILFCNFYYYQFTIIFLKVASHPNGYLDINNWSCLLKCNPSPTTFKQQLKWYEGCFLSAVEIFVKFDLFFRNRNYELTGTRVLLSFFIHIVKNYYYHKKKKKAFVIWKLWQLRNWSSSLFTASV